MVYLKMVMKNKTITVDIETWIPSVLSNTTGGIHPGELMIMTAGRGTGKSRITQYANLWNAILDKPLVMRWQQLPGRKLKAHITDTSRGIRDADMDEVQQWIWTNIPTAKRMSFDMWLFKEDKHITMFLMKWS